MIVLGNPPGRTLCWAIIPTGRCRNPISPKGFKDSGFCEDCFYPGITEQHAEYETYKSQGFGHIVSATKAGLLASSN